MMSDIKGQSVACTIPHVYVRVNIATLQKPTMAFSMQLFSPCLKVIRASMAFVSPMMIPPRSSFSYKRRGLLKEAT